MFWKETHILGCNIIFRKEIHNKIIFNLFASILFALSALKLVNHGGVCNVLFHDYIVLDDNLVSRLNYLPRLNIMARMKSLLQL